MTHPNDKRAEAARWVERMHSPVFDARDGAEFDAWMLRDPDHRECYAEMAALWGDRTFSEALREPPNDVIGPDVSGWRAPWRFLTIGGLAGACAGLALVIVPPALPRHYESEPGAPLTVRLADGTQLELNGESRVTVQYLPWSRSVRLERGEALFDVVHAAARPFRVSAGPAQIEVLGTAFNVDRQGQAQVAVQVVRGRVALSAGGEPTTLGRGDAARVVGGEVVRTDFHAEDVSWRAGWFVAREVPLAVVVEKLRRYAPRPIEVRPGADLGRLVTGRFEVGDYQGVLEVIDQVYGLTVTDDGQRIVIS